jgi:hypothetical protein
LHQPLSESPYECETFGQDVRLALGVVAEYGYRGLAVRRDAEHRSEALKIAVIGQCVVWQDEEAVLRDLGLTSNQVWGLTKTDQEWSEKLDRALTATRGDDLEHGTNAAYVHGCVCSECREYQRVRMARMR